MMMSPTSQLSFLLFFLIIAGASEDFCPNQCQCRRASQREDDTKYIKMKCGEKEAKIESLDEIELFNIADEILQWNLSNNKLTIFYPKIQLISLQKLDLSGNLLTELHNNQFAMLPNLRRLDVSSNRIKTIELLAFSNLNYLERLRLHQNQINSINYGTFDPLTTIKQLDISNNPLTCDCSLLWLLDWAAQKSVKLISNPTCHTPVTFRGLQLRKLKVGQDIHCKSPALNNGFPIIEMRPAVNQVVFEGDSLDLECRAPSISDTPTASKMVWGWLDSDPKSYFRDVSIDNHFLQSTGFIASSLRIEKLQRNHTGIWSCLLMSLQGNYSKGITVVVISKETQYCPITVTSSNKGTYTWPRTVVNHTVTIPCESQNLNDDLSIQKASYFCSAMGEWKFLNTSLCSYTSETTRILQQFSKVNSSVMESAKHFRNYTMTLTHFHDVMDVVFAVKTMENYLNDFNINQIGGVLMDVINSLLDLPKLYLAEANYLYKTCEKIVDISEKLAGISSTALLHKNNIATGQFPVQKSNFAGLKCTWYADIEKKTDRLFYCLTSSSQIDSTTSLRGKITEASITIPETLYQKFDSEEDVEEFDKILIAMHANNKLFPINRENQGTKDVTTAVVGVKLLDDVIRNLTDPVFIMLKVPESLPESGWLPVWWDPDLNNWSSDGCHFNHHYNDHIVFYCHNFGYYGLLQDVTNANIHQNGAKFKLSHPAIYVGTLILYTSLLVAIVTYLMCFNLIQMQKKAKHSLINMWLAMCCLCFLYNFGIYQTENLKLCQIIGMLLHYFTLATLLWMCVGVNCMYKHLSKNDILELNDDELPTPPVKKPILGIYFVGWGVGIIICGISAAINIRDYASTTYCFLRVGPPLSALYIPSVILLVFLAIFCLLIRCTVANLDLANGHLSDGTQATENVDLDLLEPNFEVRSVLSAITSSKTASSDVEDPEHGPGAQLKAYVICLVIFLLVWLSGAFATVDLNFQHNDLFSILYSVFAVLLSVFTLFFYCVARSDVRGQWIVFWRWLRRKRFRGRNVSDAVQNLPQIHHNIQQQQLGDLPTRSSSRSSSRTKSHSHGSNVVVKAAVDLNCPPSLHGSEVMETKINNVNLIVLHRQQYRTNLIPNIIENPTNAAEVFYNPQQSIVAKKFFKRQKRHLMKRNNLITRPVNNDHSDSASVMSSIKQIKDNSGIFSTNSKVNNTNIHVEQPPRRKRVKNPNIFSDSGSEDLYDVRNLVLTAEKLKSRKKSNNVAEVNMRTVSQQCTLDYSSDNISVVDIKTSPNEPEPTSSSNLPLDGEVGRRRVQNSASVSDLDELYQQIRGGQANKKILTRNSPCFSDSDINSYVNLNRRNEDGNKEHMSDDVETTV